MFPARSVIDETNVCYCALVRSQVSQVSERQRILELSLPTRTNVAVGRQEDLSRQRDADLSVSLAIYFALLRISLRRQLLSSSSTIALSSWTSIPCGAHHRHHLSGKQNHLSASTGACSVWQRYVC